MNGKSYNGRGEAVATRGGTGARHGTTRAAVPAPLRGRQGARSICQWGSSPAQPKPATEAARGFLAWLGRHGLCREWTVDDVWYLAEADFAVALAIPLPPRRVFLGELQKLAGVRVTYDRRVYDRAGHVIRKTTFYSFTAPRRTAVQQAMKLAA